MSPRSARPVRTIEDAVQAFNAITTPGDYTLEIIKSGTYA